MRGSKTIPVLSFTSCGLCTHQNIRCQDLRTGSPELAMILLVPFFKFVKVIKGSIYQFLTSIKVYYLLYYSLFSPLIYMIHSLK